MELLGEEVSQLWGRRPLYIVGGTNQPLPPFCPEESGSTAVPAVLPLCQRYYRLAHSGTTAEGGRYYRTGAVLRPPQPRPVP